MGKSLISNPPYNLKWSVPPFASLQPRFASFEVPPASNANYAFILSAWEEIDDKAAILLPNGVLTTTDKSEEEIKKQLVEDNAIEAIINLPDKMFESTGIPTCIVVLNKQKQTRRIAFIDLRKSYVEEIREQKGQYGGASHERRIYKKTVNVLTEEIMHQAINAISELKDIPGFSKAATIEEIRKNDYILTASRYIEIESEDEKHREYADIAADYNRIISYKNAVKLTVNESLAKTLGLYDMAVGQKASTRLEDTFAVIGQKCEKEAFISLSKNKAEFKIENKDTEHFPEMLQLFMQMWKQHIMYLNNEENRLLAELRDAMLPDLMSGKIKV